MIGPRDGDLDLVAVARDDELLDLLAARADLAVGPQGEPDETARLLQALARDVDDGLTELLAPPLPRQRARRRSVARGTALALVVGATLSVGGVSAAVTGDPLAGYRAVATALGLHSDLPPSAAEIAKWNHSLAQAKALARDGDVATATAMLDRLEQRLAELPEKHRAVMIRKIAMLRARLADAAVPGRPDSSRGQGAGKPTTAPERGKDRADQGSGAGRTDKPAKPDTPKTRPEEHGGPGTGGRADDGPGGTQGRANGQADRTSDAPSTGDQPAPTSTTEPVAPTPEPTVTDDTSDTTTTPGKSRGNGNGRASRTATASTDVTSPGGATNGGGGNGRR